jgi:hypothetical protein
MPFLVRNDASARCPRKLDPVQPGWTHFAELNVGYRQGVVRRAPLSGAIIWLVRHPRLLVTILVVPASLHPGIRSVVVMLVSRRRLRLWRKLHLQPPADDQVTGLIHQMVIALYILARCFAVRVSRFTPRPHSCEEAPAPAGVAVWYACGGAH